MTPAYCSPEQANGMPLSRKTDIWSWAISVFEMFAGEPPCRYGGQLAPEVFESYLEKGVEEDALPLMPKPLANLLQRCFRRDPTERPRTLREAAEELEGIYGSTCGHVFSLQEPKVVELAAGNLNNQALSLIDLGRISEAEQCWDEGCALDSSAVDPLYNLSLFRIRSQRARRYLSRIRNWIDGRFAALDQTDGAVIARAHILAELGEFKSAERCITRRAGADELSVTGKALLNTIAEIAATPSALPVRNFSVPVARGSEIFIDRNWHRALIRSNRAATETADREFQLFDMQAGTMVRRVPSPGLFQKIAATRDLRYLSIISRLGSFAEPKRLLTLWEISSGEAIAQCEWGLESTSHVITDDGRTIFFSEENKIRSVTLDRGRLIFSDVDRIEFPMRLRLFEDAEFLVASGYNTHEPNKQNPETLLIALGSKQNVFSIPTTMGAAVVCPSKRQLIGARDLVIHIFDIETKTVAFYLAGHTSNIRAMTVSKDESLLASASDDGTVRLWDMDRRSCRKVYEIANDETNSIPVVWVDISPDGQRLLTATAVGDICEWEIPTIERRYHAPWLFSHPMPAEQIAKVETQYESLLASATQHGSAGLHWNCAQAVIRARSLRGKSREPRSIEIWGSLYSKMKKGRLNAMWQLASKKPNNDEWFSHLSEIFVSDSLGYFCLAETTRRVLLLSVPDLRTIASFGRLGRKLHVLDVTRSGTIAMLWGDETDSGHTGVTVAMASLSDTAHINTTACNETFFVARFDNTGAYLLLGTETGEVRVFDVAANRLVRSFPAHDSCISSLAVSPSGAYLATAPGDSYDDAGGPARLWNWHTGELVGEIGTQSVNDWDSLLFSPDSSMLIFHQQKLGFWSMSDLTLRHEIDCVGSISWCDIECERISVNSGGETFLLDLHSGSVIRSFSLDARFSSECRYAISIERYRQTETVVCYFLDWELKSQ
jgi:WD40 repeat protein